MSYSSPSRYRSMSSMYMGGGAEEGERGVIYGGEAPVEGGRSSGWIAHVKAYARKHGISYGDALHKAAPSWRSRR